MTLSAATINNYQQAEPLFGGISLSYAVAVDIIYRGAAVMVNSSGYLAPCSNTSSQGFVGFAQETVDNSAGSAGDLRCDVLVGGYIKLALTSVAITNINDGVYADSDNTFDYTDSSGQLIGYIVAIPATGTAIVRLNPYPIATV